MNQSIRKKIKQQIFITLAGALILSVWGALSWQVFSWHQDSVKKFTSESAVINVLSENAPKAGLYLLPYDKKDRTNASVFMFGMVNTSWHKRSAATTQLIHFLMHAVAVYIVAWMFAHIKQLSYWRKVGFTTLVGLFAATVIVLPYWNFLQYPLDFAIVSILDITIGWFLAGLAIAKIHTMHE